MGMARRGFLDLLKGNRRNKDTYGESDGGRDSRGSLGNSSKRGKGERGDGVRGGKSRNGKGVKGWLPLMVVGVIVVIGVFNSKVIPFVFDRSGVENFNRYIVDVEETNKFPMGKERTGDSIYDKNQLNSDQIYDMGDDRYYVYIYTQLEDIDGEYNEYIREYEERAGNYPVYKIKSSLLSGEGEGAEWYSQAPMLLEMMRVGQTSMVLQEYTNVEEWKESWELEEDVLKGK